MNKFLGYIFTPIHYIAFGLLLVIFHPIQWLGLKLGGYKGHKKCVDLLNGFLVSTYYLMGSRVTFTNKQNLPLNRSIMFVANHQSMYDIPPLIWFLRKYHAKFISKIELAKGIPSISFNLKYGGGANIDRKDTKQAVSEIIKLGKRMKDNNWSVVIFPEGTRSRDGRLKPFAVGGIATIIKKVPEVLIVPVAINNSWKFVRFGKFPLSFGEHMTWEVLPPIEIAGRPVEEVLEEAHNAIQASLHQ